MQHAELWHWTKYELRGGRLRASLDPREVATSSRITADLVASFYERVMPCTVHGDLVDLGCGKAPLFGVYRNYAVSVTLVDWAASIHANAHLDVVQDLNEALSLASEAFDTVVLSDVLEHIREPQLLMGEIARVLRPGGWLLVNVPFMYGLHEVPHDYYRYTRHGLEYLASQAGLEIVSLDPLGGWLEVVADLVSKAMVRLGAVGRLATATVHRVVIGLHATQVGRNTARSTGRWFPLGYAIVARKPLAPDANSRIGSADE